MFGLIEKAIPMEKRRIQAKDLWLFASQVGVWAAILLLFPLVMLLGTRNWESTSTSMLMVWQLLRAPLAVYFANFYLLAPFLFFRRKYWLFALCNLVLILGLNYGFFFGYFAMKEQMPEMTGEAWIGFFSGAFFSAGFSAGNVVKEISGLVGGKGGGRPNMAQAGGKDAAGIDAALDAAKKLLGA